MRPALGVESPVARSRLLGGWCGRARSCVLRRRRRGVEWPVARRRVAGGGARVAGSKIRVRGGWYPRGRRLESTRRRWGSTRNQQIVGQTSGSPREGHSRGRGGGRPWGLGRSAIRRPVGRTRLGQVAGVVEEASCRDRDLAKLVRQLAGIPGAPFVPSTEAVCTRRSSGVHEVRYVGRPSSRVANTW
jgi:hypothetical protein